MRRRTIVGLGEVLWDVFPTHKQLGGAPTNFAYISSLLGDEGVVASRIGNDAMGSEAVERLDALGLTLTYLQTDADRPTGTVQVEVGRDGQPRFTITEDVAWDHLGWTVEWEELARRADAVCFGTLAQRGPQSRATIQRFVRATKLDALRVFDINLRQSFYSAQVLSDSATQADIVKLSHEEVRPLMESLGEDLTTDLEAARWLCDQFELRLVCITRGSNGSLLVTPTEQDEHPGYRVTVADTVGAGDAFTATLVHHFMRGSELARMNDAANRIGSWVASQRGGTPAAEHALIEKARALGA